MLPTIIESRGDFMVYRPIESDMTAAQGVAAGNANRNIGRMSPEQRGAFWASTLGPVTAASLAYSGDMRGSDIVAAGVNGAVGGGYYPGAGYGASYGTDPGTRMAYASGAGMRGVTGPDGPTGNPADNIAGEIADAQSSGMVYLQLQFQMSQVTTQQTTLSNIEKARDEAHRSIINNVK